MQVPRHVRGQALLCYDTRAASHVPAVKRVLDEVCWLPLLPLSVCYLRVGYLRVAIGLSTSALVLPIATYPHLSSRVLTHVAVC